MEVEVGDKICSVTEHTSVESIRVTSRMKGLSVFSAGVSDLQAASLNTLCEQRTRVVCRSNHPSSLSSNDDTLTHSRHLPLSTTTTQRRLKRLVDPKPIDSLHRNWQLHTSISRSSLSPHQSSIPVDHTRTNNPRTQSNTTKRGKRAREARRRRMDA